VCGYIPKPTIFMMVSFKASKKFASGLALSPMSVIATPNAAMGIDMLDKSKKMRKGDGLYLWQR
jgi:hypothetical protein